MSADLSARLDEVLRPYNVGDAPGLVVGVAKDGVPLLRRGYGLASLESLQANGPATRMRIGSTTKHFACVLALLAERDGLCSIDDPIGRWVPELPERQGARTLRQLMTHTGGMRDSLDLSLISNGMATMPADGPLAYQRVQREDNFAAGERFSYNNGGYRLLSIALERMLDAPFARILRERLFQPLGLHDTELWASDQELLRGVAASHVRRTDGEGFTRGVFPAVILGEGGIVSTIDDMQRWLAHLQAPTLWSPELGARLWAPTRLANGFENPYGFGLIRERWRGVELLHHAGSVVGGSCQMLAVPEHGLALVAMSNRNDVAAPEVVLRLVEAILGDALAPAAPAAECAGDAPLVGHYYCEERGEHAELVVRDGKLMLSWFGLPLPLTRSEDGTLAVNLLSVIDLRVKPLPAADADRVDALEIVEQGYRHAYRRIDPAEVDGEAALASVAGRWHCPDLDAEIRIGGEAPAAMRVRGRYGRSGYRLTPLLDGAFAVAAEAMDVPMHGVLRRVAGADGGTELRLTTMRTRDLRLLAGRADD